MNLWPELLQRCKLIAGPYRRAAPPQAPAGRDAGGCSETELETLAREKLAATVRAAAKRALPAEETAAAVSGDSGGKGAAHPGQGSGRAG